MMDDSNFQQNSPLFSIYSNSESISNFVSRNKKIKKSLFFANEIRVDPIDDDKFEQTFSKIEMLGKGKFGHVYLVEKKDFLKQFAAK